MAMKYIPAGLMLCGTVLWAGPRPPDIPFTAKMIDGGASETAAVADINKDGRLDIVSGEFWYEAPAWTAHRFRELNFQSHYIDNFSDLPVDADGDGYPDIVSVSWFAKRVAWGRNPGKAGGMWKEAVSASDRAAALAVEFDLPNRSEFIARAKKMKDQLKQGSENPK